MQTTIRIMTRPETYEERKRQLLDAGYEIDREAPVPVNGHVHSGRQRNRIPKPMERPYATDPRAPGMELAYRRSRKAAYQG
jgi:hypothetical protein